MKWLVSLAVASMAFGGVHKNSGSELAARREAKKEYNKARREGIRNELLARPGKKQRIRKKKGAKVAERQTEAYRIGHDIRNRRMRGQITKRQAERERAQRIFSPPIPKFKKPVVKTPVEDETPVKKTPVKEVVRHTERVQKIVDAVKKAKPAVRSYIYKNKNMGYEVSVPEGYEARTSYRGQFVEINQSNDPEHKANCLIMSFPLDDEERADAERFFAECTEESIHELEKNVRQLFPFYTEYKIDEWCQDTKHALRPIEYLWRARTNVGEEKSGDVLCFMENYMYYMVVSYEPDVVNRKDVEKAMRQVQASLLANF